MADAKPVFSERALEIVADDKIRSAIAAGEFDHLPGLGQPHPIFDEPYDPQWWLRRKLASEKLGTDGFDSGSNTSLADSLLGR